MAGRPRVNWAEVRAAYVEGTIPDTAQPFIRQWPTLGETAALFGIADSAVEGRSARERWVEQREAFETEVAQARRRHVVEQRAGQATRVDERGLSAAEAGLGLVGMRLTFLLNQQVPRAPGERGHGVDARELSALGLAGKRFLDMKAQIMHEPLTAGEATVDETEREQRLAEQRLAEDLVAFIAERAREDAEDLADA